MVVTQQSKLRSDPFGQWSPYGRHEAEADPGEWLPVSQPNAAPPLHGVPKEYGLRAVAAQGYGSRESLLSEKSLLGENSDWTPHQTVALLSTHRSAPTFRPRSAPAHRPAPLFLLKSASTASVAAPCRPSSAAAPSGGGSASGLASGGDSGAALAASFTLASSIELAGDSATASRLRPPRPQSASVLGGTRPSRTELWAAKKAAKESRGLQASVTQSRTEHRATQQATGMKERRKVLTDGHPQDGEANSESMPQDRVSRWHGSTEARTQPDPLLATTQRENVQRQSNELFMAHKLEEMSAQILRLDATIRSRNECIATLTRELDTTRHALQVANSRVWQPGENWQPGKYAGTSSGVVNGVGGSDEAEPVRVCRVSISVRR